MRSSKGALFVLISASAVAAVSQPQPASARTTECRERAIKYCKDNWQPEGYANRNACVADVVKFECSGASGSGSGPTCWMEGVDGWYPAGRYPYDC